MTNAERYYGNKPKLLEEYKNIERSGKCPFCPEGIEAKGFSIVAQTYRWTAVLSQFPYENTGLHLLIVPNRHVISVLELSHLEWDEMHEMIKLAQEVYPILKNGFGLGMREKELGGVTLYHLHFHLILPKANSEGGAEIEVNFKIG